MKNGYKESMKAISALVDGNDKVRFAETAFDGWRTICGWEVYVENGYIVRGISADHQTPLYIYRACRSGGYDREYKITPDAFRAGLRRGTIVLR